MPTPYRYAPSRPSTAFILLPLEPEIALTNPTRPCMYFLLLFFLTSDFILSRQEQLAVPHHYYHRLRHWLLLVIAAAPVVLGRPIVLAESR